MSPTSTNQSPTTITPPENPQPKPTPQPSATAKTSHKTLILLVGIMSVVAVLGVAFGVWQLIENSQAHQRITALEAEVEEKKQLITKYGAMLGLDASQNNKPGNSSNSENKNPSTDSEPNLIASKDYIYVGEWGIKFKIPEGLKNVSYVFNNDLSPEHDGYQSDASSICATGILDSMTSTPESFQIHNNRPGFGCVSRISKEELIRSGRVSADDQNLSDYNYIYSGPQAVTGTNDEEVAWELEIVKLVKDMLSNPDNQSKF